MSTLWAGPWQNDYRESWKETEEDPLVRTGCLKWIVVVGLAVLGSALSTDAEVLWLRVGVAGMA